MDLDRLNPLESTNRVISDLERKLSINSTTSTQHSHSSSVIINRQHLGIGKLNVSNVLLYISNNSQREEMFNANELYEERQRISRSKSSSIEPESFKGKAQFEYDDDDDEDDEDDEITENKLESEVDGDGLKSPVDNAYYGDYDYDDDEDDDSFDDLVPPSPPRSPPREIDPDKLYGLYDFSGPDPLHCTLYRDEPVYLLNDEDNYWWLIQKLTKEEKGGVIGEGESDEEDGKIGFVPAECLETYGERLARLNCFKNEEIEKSESGNSSNTTPTNNINLNSNIGTGTISKKSVTFEDLASLKFDDVDEEGDEEEEEERMKLKQIQHFPDNIFSMPAGSLGPPIVEKQGSEVLSDIFPDVKLTVNKKKKQDSNEEVLKSLNNRDDEFGFEPIKSIAVTSATPETTPTINLNSFDPPPRRPVATDTSSIGSYSPDTPPNAQKDPRIISNSSIEEEKAIRRSVILERLNQVTADIQEQLSIQDDLNYSDMEKIMFGLESKEDLLRSQDEEEEEEEEEEDYNHSLDSVRRIVATKNQSGEDLDADISNETFTPSTSTASLVDKSKDKSIHDMFVPILGKFDELAERLEELNDILR